MEQVLDINSVESVIFFFISMLWCWEKKQHICTIKSKLSRNTLHHTTYDLYTRAIKKRLERMSYVCLSFAFQRRSLNLIIKKQPKAFTSYNTCLSQFTWQVSCSLIPCGQRKLEIKSGYRILFRRQYNKSGLQGKNRI